MIFANSFPQISTIIEKYCKKGFHFIEYKNAQEKANKSKLKTSWVQENEIELMSDWLKEYRPDADFGICHGSRSGFEVEKFREHLNIDVIGTDISETANSLPHMIRWDMHDVKYEWINKVDFIYSNSTDHTYDPYLCFKSWFSCLKNDGVLLLHLSTEHFEFDHCSVDCFRATKEEYESMVTKNGKIIDTIETVVIMRGCSRYRFIWVIENTTMEKL